MISALKGLSNQVVSFGSATDVQMQEADSILRKRTAEEKDEVQGHDLGLTFALNYDGQAGEQAKKGRKRDDST